MLAMEGGIGLESLPCTARRQLSSLQVKVAATASWAAQRHVNREKSIALIMIDGSKTEFFKEK